MAGADDLSEIQKFYAGKHVLITGGTGFLGRILLEKLLRSCRQIKAIYLLTRSKKGKSSEERIDELFDNVVFEPLKKEFPDFKKKIVIVAGDISVERLGLSTEDRELIVENVNIIFHAAATVRFNEPLKRAVAFNVDSTKNIVHLSRECKSLQATIYVSTAYSHCPRSEIGEELYPPPLNYEEVHEIIDHIEERKISTELLETETKLLLDPWPNTYTFSKAIAESVIPEYGENLPIGIFRPSMVVGAWETPLPGWTNTFMGVNGLITGLGLGIIHTLWADINCVCDLVPVDMVCNCLIATAWEIATNRDRQGHAAIPVYNYVSGKQNPVTWNQALQHCTSHGNQIASNYAVTYNFLFDTKSKLLFTVLDILFHALPALLVDFVRRLFGKEPIVYGYYCKAKNIEKYIQFFGLRGWAFKDDKVRALWNRLESADKEIFPFDIKTLMWREYLRRVILGVQKYLLKEPDSTLERARRKRLILCIIHNLLRAAFYGLVIWIGWKIFGGYVLAILYTPN